MTDQQMQYAYWQRMRQQQLYKAYVAGKAQRKNAYDKIAKVSDDWFLNYIEYDAKNISPDKVNAYLKNMKVPVSHGACTGVHKGNMVLRQLDWYFNNQAEFVIRMKACPEKGVKYSSIGVTATSPKLEWQVCKHCIETGAYYEYFDMLPYMTVDGVNEKGIFAQSNVVEKNGINTIDINPGKEDCCCSIMLVRYILDRVSDIGDGSSTTDNGSLSEVLDSLHLYSASPKAIAYNNHILVADAKGNSKIIEFKEDHYEITTFPVMTNFRTNDGFAAIGSGASMQPDWSTVEWNGIGLERWTAGIQFVNDGNPASLQSFKDLRSKLNYTHAYDRPVMLSTWLTDNLSADLSVLEAKQYHEGTLSGSRKDLYDNVLSSYRNSFEHRTRAEGSTWITTHSCIYDLANLSCNIQSQEQDTCWNVSFDGTIAEEPTETVGGKWLLFSNDGVELAAFDQYSEPNPLRRWESADATSGLTFGASRFLAIPHWELQFGDYVVDDAEKAFDSTAKMLVAAKSGYAEKFTLRWCKA